MNSLAITLGNSVFLKYTVRLVDPLPFPSLLRGDICMHWGLGAGEAGRDSPCLTRSIGNFVFLYSPHLWSLSSDPRHLPVPQCSQRLQITQLGQAGTKNIALAGGRRNKDLVAQPPRTTPLSSSLCLLIKHWDRDKISPSSYSDTHLHPFPKIIMDRMLGENSLLIKKHMSESTPQILPIL